MEGVEEQVSVLQFLLFFFYSRHHHKVVKRIREDWGQTQLSEDLLRRIDGILDVNSVEHRVTHIHQYKYTKIQTQTHIVILYVNSVEHRVPMHQYKHTHMKTQTQIHQYEHTNLKP